MTFFFPIVTRVDAYGGDSGESLVELRGAAGNVFRAFCDGLTLSVGDVLDAQVLEALEVLNDFEDIFDTGREPLGIGAVGTWDAIAHGRVVDHHDAAMLVDAGDALVVVDGLTHDPRVIGSLVRLVMTRVEIVPQSSYPGLFERADARWTYAPLASFSRFIASGGADATSAARWRGQLLGPTIRREQVEAQLGPPMVRTDRTIGYQLVGFPRHVYTFEYDDRGVQRRAGFRRLGTPYAVPSTSSLAALVEHEVTEDELVHAFGEPISRTGWWPFETLSFSNGLEIELRHGIVWHPAPATLPATPDAIVATYRDAAFRHGERRPIGVINKAADDVLAALRALRGLGEDGIQRLEPLLFDPSPSVRLWAATHLLPIVPRAAEATLTALANGPVGSIKASAAMTLHLWRTGRLEQPGP